MMKKYLVSTTTHRNDGEQIDNWKKGYIEAPSKDKAIQLQGIQEMNLLPENAKDVFFYANKTYYTLDGEDYYIQIYAEEA